MKTYPLNVIDDVLNQQIRRQYVKIELLNWTEETLEEITGIVKTGNYSENGSSSARRTLTLTFSTVDRNDEKIINKLKLSNKIKVAIGFKNTTNKLIVQDDILWFNLGIYIPVSVSLSHNATTSSINLSCSDKMSLMNGSLGGMISTPTTFAIKNKDNTYTSMSWRDIFINSASTLGSENPGKIIIENVPDLIRVVGQVKEFYGVKKDLIFIDAPDNMTGERCIVDGWMPDLTESDIKKKLVIHQGEKIYGLKKFAPPEPTTINKDNSSQDGYIVNIGENITKIFEDIITQLNKAHQYYYDVNGNLRLEPIHDYMVYEEDDKYYEKHHYELNTDAFKPNFTRMPITYDFSDKKTVISYSNSQNFSNVKNDFVLSGENGKKLEIAIDKKITTEEIIEWFKKASSAYAGKINNNILDYCNEGMEGEKRQNIYYKTIDNQTKKEIYVVRYPTKIDKNGKVIQYTEVNLEGLPWQIAHGIRSWHIRHLNGLSSGQINNTSINSIYNQNMNNQNYRWGYECEQLIYQKTVDKDGNWVSDKGIFNLNNWQNKNGNYWKTSYSTSTKATTEKDEIVDYTEPNFDNIGDSSVWNYWIDIIEDVGIFSEYGINKIGKRTYSQKIDNCNMIFRTGYHDLIIIEENYFNTLENKDFILKTLREKKTPYAIVKNSFYYFTELDTFKDSSTQEIIEAKYFNINEQTKDGNIGYFQPTDKQKVYCGGLYSGGKEDIVEMGYNLTKENEDSYPTDLLFFPNSNTEENTLSYITPNTKKEFKISKGKQYLTIISNLGEEEKKYGYSVAFPANYPRNIDSESKEEDKKEQKNELNSPLMLFYSQSKVNKKLKGFHNDFDNKLHPCFICGRYNNDKKTFQYWGLEEGKNNKWKWYDWVPGKEDIIIGYAVSKTSSNISLMFNMEKGDMSNLFSYNSDNDLFNSIMPIIVQKTNTADNVSINCLLNPYIETNTLIKLYDEHANIDGIYKVNTISYALNNSTMTIGATKMNKYLI